MTTVVELQTMSKLGLISDIHGDPLALELAWAHLTVLGADRIVCAGDVVGYGPFPDRVVAFLQEHQIPSVRGNHDRWALQRPLGAPDTFGGGTPSSETLDYLERLEPTLVFELDRRIVVVVHGSPASDMEFLNPSTHPTEAIETYLERCQADLLISGHTHRPIWYRGLRGLYVNPGSVVSAPVVQTSRTFALLDLKTLEVTFHDVESGAMVEVQPWPEQS